MMPIKETKGSMLATLDAGDGTFGFGSTMHTYTSPTRDIATAVKVRRRLVADFVTLLSMRNSPRTSQKTAMEATQWSATAPWLVICSSVSWYRVEAERGSVIPNKPSAHADTPNTTLAHWSIPTPTPPAIAPPTPPSSAQISNPEEDPRANPKVAPQNARSSTACPWQAIDGPVLIKGSSRR